MGTTPRGGGSNGVNSQAGKHPIEMQLLNIVHAMRETGPILECLKAIAFVHDFKFTSDDRSTAYVKFMAHEPGSDSLINAIRTVLASTG